MIMANTPTQEQIKNGYNGKHFDKYGYISGFWQGFAACKLDNKLGVIDEQGNVVIPFDYPYYKNCHNGWFIVGGSDGGCGVIKDGRIVADAIYADIELFLPPTYSEFMGYHVVITSSENKKGLLSCVENHNNETGITHNHVNVSLDMLYDDIKELAVDGFPVVIQGEGLSNLTQYFEVRKDSLYGVFNRRTNKCVGEGCVYESDYQILIENDNDQ